MASGGFELYQQQEDGSRGPPLARGSMLDVVTAVRKHRLLAIPDPHHPLGCYYVDAAKGIYVIDFFLDR